MRKTVRIQGCVCNDGMRTWCRVVLRLPWSVQAADYSSVHILGTFWGWRSGSAVMPGVLI